MRIQNLEPQLLRRYLLLGAPLGHILRIQLAEVIAPHLLKPRSLIGAEQAPLAIGLHALHEEVRNPERVEEVARPLLLSPRIELQLQEILNVGVPRLQVHGEAPIAPPALIHIARRVIEDAEHRHKTVARAIRATNPRATRANIGAVQANATRVFADVRAIIQRLEDAGDTVVVHGHEETG